MRLTKNWQRCEYFKLNIFAEFLPENVYVFSMITRREGI